MAYTTPFTRAYLVDKLALALWNRWCESHGYPTVDDWSYGAGAINREAARQRWTGIAEVAISYLSSNTELLPQVVGKAP